MVKIELLKNTVDSIYYEITYKKYKSIICSFENIDGIIERNAFILNTCGKYHEKWGT